MNNGIEKITEKILADARKYADAKIAAANAEAEDIIASAQMRAESISDSYRRRISAIDAESKARAASAEEFEMRNAGLAVRAEMIGRVFSAAHDRLLAMPDDRYLGFLEKLLSGAMKERENSESAKTETLDDYDEFDKYELLLNARDRERFGEKLTEFACKASGDKPVVLSGEVADIDGGFLLRWGAVDLNCSFSQLVSRAREDMERDVCEILYPLK